MSLNRRKSLFMFFALAVLVVPGFGLLFLHLRPAAPRVRPGGSLPDFAVWNVDGSRRSIREARGNRPTLLLFAKPECGYCQSEVSTLDRLQQVKRENANLIVIFIPSRDQDGRKHAAELSKTAPSLTVFLDKEHAFQNLFGGGQVPLAVAVSADGVIRSLLRGERTGDFLQNIIDQINGGRRS
jgi:thiol-disulfide isomerase/thioredoxin